jgi:hypothetical protein
VTLEPKPTKPVEVAHEQPPTTTPPTRDECHALAQRMVQLASSERPADQQISQAEQDTIVAAMTCEGVNRDIYDCAMAASTTTAMAACDQRTPSSSTSNSSVAPGGMTPPAPRAP